MKKSKKYNYDDVTPTEIYELVRCGKIKRFPKYFWTCDDGEEYTPKITRYLIEQILKWNDEDIKNMLRKETFRENYLSGMLFYKYNDSPFKAIIAAFPEKNFHAWDFVNAPNYYWQGDKGRVNAINAVRWLIEEKLQWSDIDIVTKLNQQSFAENNLLGMLKKAFNCTLFNAIDAAYPGRFKKWQLGEHVQNDYWNREEGKKAVVWLIEDKLKWNDEDIKNHYCKEIFKDNQLYGMIQRCFSSSPFEAINSTYPNRFKEWELPNVPKNYWSSEINCAKATKWLIEEKLKINVLTAKEILTYRNFEENGLVSLIDKYKIAELLKFL